MTTPTHATKAERAPISMTPERWRAVDAVLKAALACEPNQRDAFVAEACVGDDALHQEVASLLAAHDRTGEDFLERPAAESILSVVAPGGTGSPLAERLGSALAGRYVIERELAHGGMATVHLARDLRHDRLVAIKVLRDELAAAVGAERFLEEIRVTASLQHPHILPLFDSGNVDGLLWYAMPFVEGETLRSRLTREHHLPVEDAVRIAREMADGLEYAHGRGVVHRDVKPENVMLQGEHALLADFGIALALEHAGGERLTRTGLTIGTPQYMAPEQAAGGGTIDARTDVYALGVVLHEMLAGESPFAAASQQEVLRRVMHEPPTALASRRPYIAPFLDAAVQRALQKKPDDRFATAAEFAAALDAPPPELRDRAKAKPSKGRRVSARVAMYTAVAMLAIGVTVGWTLARSKLVAQWMSGVPNVKTPTIAASLDHALAGAASLRLSVVDRAGRPLSAIPANRPWTPRFSPDGHRVAYGAFGAGRNTSDLWVTDLDAGTTERLTDDDTDSNDPQWSADGKVIAYSASAPDGKDLLVRPLGGAMAKVLAVRPGVQFPSDWLRNGSALLVTEDAGRNRRDILVQPADGSLARPYSATPADEYAARVSPDGRWVAYTSDESGRPEVYVDSYRRPGRRVLVSQGGGQHPVWRGDGQELYYWRAGALVAVQLGSALGGAPPVAKTQTELFRAAYAGGLNLMYDVSRDGKRFVIVARP